MYELGSLLEKASQRLDVVPLALAVVRADFSELLKATARDISLTGTAEDYCLLTLPEGGDRGLAFAVASVWRGKARLLVGVGALLEIAAFAERSRPAYVRDIPRALTAGLDIVGETMVDRQRFEGWVAGGVMDNELLLRSRNARTRTRLHR